MKKEVILVLTLLTTLSFVSAFGEGIGNFGFSGLFSSLNVEMYLYALLFATIFSVVFFILGRTPFRNNSAVKWIISLCASSFTIYGIILSGFSFQEFFYNIGISSDILPTVLWMAAAIAAIIIIAKLKLRRFIIWTLTLGGIVFILLSVLGVFYNGGAGIGIGVVLLLIAFAISKILKRRGEYLGLNLEERAKYKNEKYSYKNRGDQKKNRKLYKQYVKRANYYPKNKRERKIYEQYSGRVNYSPKNANSLAPINRRLVKRSIAGLRDEYLRIEREDPRDPRLHQIVKDIKELRRNR